VDLTPSEIGARAEREVAYALERCGWAVYLPMFAAHARVDLVVVRGSRVLRVQVKTSTFANGALSFRVCSNTRNVPRAYDGEIDAFGAYSPELHRSYLVPADLPATRRCFLRVEPCGNGQTKGIRLAADYELTPPG
jgi:hypothetical protein